MSDEIFANVQVPDSVQSVLQVGSLYNYENAIIVSEVTQADLRAGLALKVNKAGDSMTGDLELEDGLAVKLDGETDYVVKSRDDAHQLVLFDNDGKGIYLDGTNNEEPYYNDGSNSYKLVNTNDILNGIVKWGNLAGTISDQTDLTNYINQLIEVSPMLGRMNFSAAVQGSVSTGYTVPSKGYVFLIAKASYGNNGSSAAASINGAQVVAVTIGTTGTETANIMVPVSTGDVVTQSVSGTAIVQYTFVPQV